MVTPFVIDVAQPTAGRAAIHATAAERGVAPGNLFAEPRAAHRTSCVLDGRSARRLPTLAGADAVITVVALGIGLG